MRIQLDTLSPNQTYHLLTQTVIPRPIAWVLSENEDESLNLAPFSFFNAMCSEPPLMALSIGRKDKETPKDTAKNILSGREFILHIASLESSLALNDTAATLDYQSSEIDHADIELADFEGAKLPRVAECPVAFQCSLYEHHMVGPNEQIFVYAQAHSVYLRDEIVSEDGKRLSIDASKINPLSRLGAAEYSSIGKPFKIIRPK